MFALAIHLIVQRIKAERNVVVHRWYSDDRMIIGKVHEVKLAHALDIITEQGTFIKFIFNPSNSKSYWPTQKSLILKPLINAYDMDLRSTSDGVIILRFPIGSPTLVSSFIHEKIDALDASLSRTAAIPDIRVGHNIHRFTMVASL